MDRAARSALTHASSWPRLSFTARPCRNVSQTNTRPFSSTEKATGLATLGSAANSRASKPSRIPNAAAAVTGSSDFSATVGFFGAGIGCPPGTASAVAPARRATRTGRTITRERTGKAMTPRGWRGSNYRRNPDRCQSRFAQGRWRIRSRRNSTGAPSDSRHKKPSAGLHSVPPETSWPLTHSRTSPSMARM